MINNVILVGRLTKDPELKYLSDGTAVTLFSLAVNRGFRNQSGGVEADFISIRLWNKVAENTANHCRKGSLVGVTGKIQTRRYEDSKGATVYVTEVIGDSVRFLERKRRSEEKREESKRVEETKQHIHV
ncbi:MULTISPECIES: single-stranded DNA-binding protein [Bacillus]|uniref:single-stranded DNA-binding protein n=1 Tax=Bacillus TaxID=1386 RepID=UPI000BB7073C|nr:MULTISPECIES: single-stranded DNA-binding protein [Bacillus]